jgi:hypothetical protein
VEKILETYKTKLNDTIMNIKTKVENTESVSDILDEIRDEIYQNGKTFLKLMFNELKSYVEANKQDFIENNKEKWEKILDKAEALSEYGLYVAPIDLIKNNENTTKAAYISAGTFFGSIVFTKLSSKKAKLLSSLFASIASGAIAYYVLDLNKDEKLKESLNGYIDDAADWMFTALENMYRIFQDVK